jgi:outer membrane protein TolC
MRKTVVLFAAVLAAFLLIPVLLAAQEPVLALRPPADTVRLTLDDALRLAERGSETVGIARAGLDRARGQERQARSGFLPQLSGTASYTRTLDSQFSGLASGDSDGGGGPVGPCDGYRPDPSLPLDQRVAELERALDCTVNSNPFGGNLPFGQANNWSLGLSLSQTVFDWKLHGRSSAAAAVRRAAAIGVDVERAQLVLDVATAYYDAVLAHRLAAIAESTLVQTERTLHDVELGHQVGTQPEFDLLRARVARDNQRPVVIRRQNALELALVRLRQLLDLSQGAPLALASDIPVAAADAPANVPAPAVELVAAADTLGGERAGVRATAERLRAAEGLHRAAVGEALPVLSVGSDYARVGFGDEVVPAWDSWVNDWTVYARLSVPLFTGGRLSGRRAEARADLHEAELRLRSARELAARDSVAALHNRASAASAWDASRGAVVQAVRAYEIAEVRFREGVSTQTELSDSRLDLAQARANEVQAARDLLVARLREALLPWLPLGAGEG